MPSSLTVALAAAVLGLPAPAGPVPGPADQVRSARPVPALADHARAAGVGAPVRAVRTTLPPRLDDGADDVLRRHERRLTGRRVRRRALTAHLHHPGPVLDQTDLATSERHQALTRALLAAARGDPLRVSGPLETALSPPLGTAGTPPPA